jgi:hypothetical protein
MLTLFSLFSVIGCSGKEESQQAETSMADTTAIDRTQVATPPADSLAMSEASEQVPQTESTAPPKTASQQTVASGELVPLDITLPKPMFIGTPQNFRVDKLEKPLGKPRPPFLAPAGTKNVAFKKSVTSTDKAPIIGEVAMITDGSKEASEGNYVELGPFKQHVTVDLGAKHDIYAILVWHFHEQPRVYFDVMVQTADDADFKTNVHTVFNNDLDNSSGLGVGEDLHYVETSEGKLVDAKGVQGRYVRLHSNGNTNNDLNHYIEVEVYGKSAGSL